MKNNVSPVAISVSAVVLVGLLVVMYRYFFPPMPPSDTDNPNKMPAYARNFLNKRKANASPGGSGPMGGGGSMPSGSGGSMPSMPGAPPGR
jgi:hypothetical protein